MIKIVALTGPLADPGKHRIAAEQLGDIVDQLLDQHGLADARAAEQADLAALGVGAQEVDDLDAGNEDFRFCRLVDEVRRLGVDRRAQFGFHRAALIDRLADHVHDAPEGGRADGHDDRAAGVDHILTAHETLSGVHGNGAHGVLAQVLCHFKHETRAVVLGFQGVQDGGQLTVELHIDNSADDLGNLAFDIGGRTHAGRLLWSGFLFRCSGGLGGRSRLARRLHDKAFGRGGGRLDHFVRLADPTRTRVLLAEAFCCGFRLQEGGEGAMPLVVVIGLIATDALTVIAIAAGAIMDARAFVAEILVDPECHLTAPPPRR